MKYNHIKEEECDFSCVQDLNDALCFSCLLSKEEDDDGDCGDRCRYMYWWFHFYSCFAKLKISSLVQMTPSPFESRRSYASRTLFRLIETLPPSSIMKDAFSFLLNALSIHVSSSWRCNSAWFSSSSSSKKPSPISFKVPPCKACHLCVRVRKREKKI